MLDFQDYSEFFNRKRSSIDNATFRLHYRVTFGILLLMSALNTSHKFIGKPIDCMTSAPDAGIVNNYCWIHGTFTAVDGVHKTEGIHPGVIAQGYDKNGNEIYHAWYQWVHIVLFIQALLCYFPHWIWESLEGGKIDMLLQGLDKETLDSPDDLKEVRLSIAHYFIRTKGTHNSYTFRFLFCEFLNLVNIIGQMFLMDKFLGGQFSSYGRDVIAMSEKLDFQNRIDPLNRVFPKLTKCDFLMYGPSGTIQNFDSLCLLPVNVINEKIYIFLWFWFIFVAVFTAIHLLLKTVSLISGDFRLFSLNNVASSITRDDLKVVLKKCNYGDWFVLMQLGKLIQPITYHNLLLDIRDRLDKKRAENLDD
ncbi:innexin inx2 [Lepeophtheirus salmonis]|uniref:Innexin n=2 Tax=Lepeophtheirus salmonis TaxID=72036 RepID=C1BSL1_LEPSM|nr:innexin inx2-like [Lepeophtheirus salmonis]ACO12014.1 Innexin inx2 [Lepeophtheirus salmonis]ADD24332.1 Innexin inx2 [Lepeophtheirus salmonis]